MESLELPTAAASLEPLLFSLKTALDRLCGRLAGSGRAAARLRLKLRCGDLPTDRSARSSIVSDYRSEPGGGRTSEQGGLPADRSARSSIVSDARSEPGGRRPTASPAAGGGEVPHSQSTASPTAGGGEVPHSDAITPARPTASAKLWLDLWRERLAELRLPGAVTALSVEAEAAVPAARAQLAFGERPREAQALESALARLSSALGSEALGALTVADSHRPEAAGARAPFTPDADAAEPESAAARPLRLWHPPRPAELAHGRDGALRLRIAQAGDRPPAEGRQSKPALSPAGARARLARLEGPERLSGEWWGDAYARDYYRAVTDEGESYWLFVDQRGAVFLHGAFD